MGFFLSLTAHVVFFDLGDCSWIPAFGVPQRAFLWFEAPRGAKQGKRVFLI